MRRRANWIPAAFGITVAVLTGIAILGHLPANSADKQETVEARLRRLEDRDAIRNLLMDYGRFLDQRDFAAFSQLFADSEGEWIGGLGKAKGPLAIRKLMEDTIGNDTNKMISAPNYHVFTNETISLDGDRAKALCKWMFVVQGEAARPQLFYLGHYEDTLVREGGHWKFLRRVVHGDIPADDSPARE